MADVAHAAGVSHQTVSRVINGSDSVRTETRERVLAAMRELDYRPNSLARALVTGRSRTLGVVSFDTTLYGPASTLFGIERAAHAQGYFVSIVSVTSLDRDLVLGAVEQLHGQGVDGMLLITPQERCGEAVAAHPARHAGGGRRGRARTRRCRSSRSTRWPARRPRRGICSSSVIGRSGTSPGPADWLEARQRVEGWTAALEAAGADPPPLLSGDWSARSGYELGQRLASVRDVTAIFAANDQMALGILRAMHEAGATCRAR